MNRLFTWGAVVLLMGCGAGEAPPVAASISTACEGPQYSPCEAESIPGGGACVDGACLCYADAQCSDDDATTNDYCSSGACVHGPLADVLSVGECEYLSCGAALPKVDGAECSLPSGDAGYCLDGVCSTCAGCDDGNECTLDACTAVGCAHYPYAAQQACTAGHCVINSYTSPDSALCVPNGMCLDRDPITKIVAPVKVCSGGQKCGFYSGMCGSI